VATSRREARAAIESHRRENSRKKKAESRCSRGGSPGRSPFRLTGDRGTPPPVYIILDVIVVILAAPHPRNRWVYPTTPAVDSFQFMPFGDDDSVVSVSLSRLPHCVSRWLSNLGAPTVSTTTTIPITSITSSESFDFHDRDDYDDNYDDCGGKNFSDSDTSVMADILPQAPPPKGPLARYRLLSPTAAVRVSPICLGAMNFGDAWCVLEVVVLVVGVDMLIDTTFRKGYMGTCDKDTTEAILDFYYDQGGTCRHAKCLARRCS